MERLKLGFIGCGGYAFHLIKRVWTLPRFATVAGVASREANHPGALACRERGIPVFPGVDELLAHAKDHCDVIVNPTPIHLHYPMTLKCLNAGFPVWMEKPPTGTVGELDELAAAAKTTGHPVQVCFNSIYGFGVQQLKRELVAGKYGRVRRVRSIGGWIRTDDYFTRNGWAGKLRAGDSWVLDGTINNPLAHLVANSLYFASGEHHAMAEPASVRAELYHGHDIESEDTASLQVRTTNGIDIICNFTLCPPDTIAPTTVVETDEAEISVVDMSEVQVRHRDGRVDVRESFKENRVEMFEELCLAHQGEAPYLCDIAMCRPFTLAVNAAFDSNGRPRAIPEKHLKKSPWDGSIKTVVDGIDTALREAHDKGCLLSETGAPWTHTSAEIDARNYEGFPTNPELLADD